MMLTKGVELSGYFDVLGRKMVRRFATERKLALFMVFSAALLSTFLTNDVALFIVVPLTLTLRKLCEIPVTRLIIFEALAVNAGSLLTPIGNPPEHSALGTLRPVVYRIYLADGAAGAGDRGDAAGGGLVCFPE